MKEREAFLDKLRAAATFSVVLLHTITGVMDTTDMQFYPVEKTVFLTVLDLICWSVPVFVLISGYLFLNPAKEITMSRMLTKYCRRIILALFLFGVPYACLEQIAVERTFYIGMIGKSFLMVLRGESWSHMWYLYLILLLYLLTPAVKWLLTHIPRYLIYLLSAAIFLVCSILPYVSRLFELEGIPLLPEEGIYFFYYICGYLFATGTLNKGTPKGKKAAKYIPFSAAVLAIAMAFSRISGTYTIRMGYNYPFTAALSLLLFAAGITAQPARNNIIWQKLSALSFTVYLIHPVFLNTAYKFLHITPLSFSIAVSLPLFFVATVLLSVASAWILDKIPLLKRYVL